MPSHRLAVICATALLAAATFGSPDVARAQGASSPPASETPRPEDIDPAVDTSAAPAREDDQVQESPSADRTGPSAPGPAPASASTESPSSPDAASASAGTSRAAAGRASDRIELDATQITGNRELPKVLYIVPWKRADLGDLVGKPVNSLLDEVLTPVDRDVFRRENRYYRALTPDPDAQAPGAATPAPTRRARDDGARAAGSVGSALQSSPGGSGGRAPPAGDEPRDER